MAEEARIGKIEGNDEWESGNTQEMDCSGRDSVWSKEIYVYFVNKIQKCWVVNHDKEKNIFPLLSWREDGFGPP